MRQKTQIISALKAYYKAQPFRGKLTIALCAVVLSFLVLWGVVRSPIGQSFLAARFVNIIEAKLGGGYGFTIGRVSVRKEPNTNRAMLFFREIDITDKETGLHLISPAAEVVLDEFHLANLLPRVKSLRLVGPTLTLKGLSKRSTELGGNKEAENNQNLPDLNKLIKDILARLERDAKASGFANLSITDANIHITSGIFGAGRTYENVSMIFEDKNEEGAQIIIEGNSDLGKSHATLTVTRTNEGTLEGDALIENLALEDLMQALRIDFGTFRMAGVLSGTARMAATDEGLKFFETATKAKSMQIVFGPLKEDHVAFDNVEMGLNWQQGDETLQLRPSLFSAGEGAGIVEGVFKISPDRMGLLVYLEGRDIRLATRDEKTEPTRIYKANMKGEARPLENKFIINSSSVEGPTVHTFASGVFTATNNAVGGEFGIAMQNTSSSSVMSMWPPFIAPQTRAAVQRIFKRGIVNDASLAIKITPEMVVQQRQGGALPEEAITLKANIHGADLTLGKDFPALQNANFDVQASGIKVEIQNLHAQSGKAEQGMIFRNVYIALTDLFEKEISLIFEGPVRGDISAFSSFILDAATPESGKNNANIKQGLLDGKVKLKAKMDSKTQELIQKSSNMVFQGNLQDLVLDLPADIGELNAKKLEVIYNGESTSLSGPVLIDGQAGSIDWMKKEGINEPELTLSFTATQSWRNKKLPDFAKSITGTIPVKLKQFYEKDKFKQTLEADLTQANLIDPMPGLNKKAKIAGHFKTSIIVSDKGTKFSDIELRAPQTDIQGEITLNEKGKLLSANFPKYRAGASQGLNISIQNQDKIQNIKIEGDAIDLRPILRTAAQKRENDTQNVSILIKSKSAIGYNSEVISDFNFSGKIMGVKLQDITFSGAIGRGTIDGKSLTDQSQRLRISTTDAGALLRFANLYKKLSGGTLEVITQTGNYPREAEINMKNFVVYGESALKNYASNAEQGNNRDGVPFTKMKAAFEETADGYNIKDAVVWGDSVGVTFEGVIEPQTELVRMTGTLVPAYALNNLFAQLPVIGLILGGGSTEGVLGVSFRVTGSFEKPKVEISPLSAVAPGFLRKFFEFRKENQ